MKRNINNDIMHPEYVGKAYSNDASASSFGWNFQYNAGIFLFLKYSDDVLTVEIENDEQDIVLELRGGKHLYAQAKSVQDYSVLDAGDKNAKIKDAIVSLSNTAAKDIDGQFIFISNIKEPIVDEDGLSRSRVICYSELNQSSQTQIDCLFKALEEKMIASITDVENNKHYSQETKVNKIARIQNDLNSLKVLSNNKDKFYLSTVVPYKGGSERFDVIKEELTTFLDKLNFSRNKITIISNRYLDYLKATFETDAGLKPKEDYKKMRTSELIWPISSILVYENKSYSEVDKYLSFTPDPSNVEVMNEYFNDEQFIYHTRFEFSNSVIQRYKEFRKTYKNKDNVVGAFLNDFWSLFKGEFDDKKLSDENLEYLTKFYLFKIITIRDDVENLCNWLGKDRL